MIPSEIQAAIRNRDENVLLKAQLEYEREVKRIDDEWHELKEQYLKNYSNLFGVDFGFGTPNWVSTIFGLFVAIGFGIYCVVDSHRGAFIPLMGWGLILIAVSCSCWFYCVFKNYRALERSYRRQRAAVHVDDFLPTENQRVLSLD